MREYARLGTGLGAAIIAAAAAGVPVPDASPPISDDPVWKVEGFSHDLAWPCGGGGVPGCGADSWDGVGWGMKLGDPGEQGFGRRFSWRLDTKEKTSDAGTGKGVCRLYLKPSVPSGLPEIRLVTLSQKQMQGLADSRCLVSFSPDGWAVGVAAAWTDATGIVHYKVKVHGLNEIEAMYWNALGEERIESDPDAALAYFSWARALDPLAAIPPYNAACVHAMTGEAESALVLLARAFERDVSLRKKARKDERLAGLKGMADFEHMIDWSQGWADVKSRLGEPPQADLPPGISGTMDPEAGSLSPGPPSDGEPHAPTEQPGPPVNDAPKGGDGGLFSSFGCSIAPVR